MTKWIYITGAGKCGTHLASYYIHENAENTRVFLKEFKNWAEELPTLKIDEQFGVFHCPGTETTRYRQLSGSGVLVIILRNPVQNYLSWVHSLTGELIKNLTFRCDMKRTVKSADNHLNNAFSTIYHIAMERVVNAFLHVREADRVWKLEDFSSDSLLRQKLVGDLLPLKGTVSERLKYFGKSNYLDTSQISPISETQYGEPLAEFEHRAMSRFDSAFIRFYPAWKELVRVDARRDEDVIMDRTASLVRIVIERQAQKSRKVSLNKLKRLDFPSVVATFTETLHQSRRSKSVMDALATDANVRLLRQTVASFEEFASWLGQS